VNLEVLDAPDSAAARAAEFIAQQMASAVPQRGRCTVALSGGESAGVSLSVSPPWTW
jgi:6-phosphogluconolactonase/glucosamine-6-phosphate isomerase/deaminase